ncbi:hypothetical protein N9X59_02910 [Alphaproteobacteria bacterium]|nr:hypothetical protein [Alphaproteobacteria bacterium]
MEYELEYTLLVREELETPSLYPYYIAEIDQNGHEIEGINHKWIPFHHSIYFLVKTISYIPSWNFSAGMFDAEDKEEDLKKTKSKKKMHAKDFHVDYDEDESIFGTMQIDPEEHLDCISMFGTERGLLDLSFRISVGKQESCRLIGIPQYSHEGANFISETKPDVLQLEITFKEEKFRKFVELVRNNTITKFPIRLDQVAGLYAVWSPSFVTSEIKVLTPHHELDDPLDFAPHFRRLGVVGEIDLSPQISQNILSETQIEQEHDDEFETELEQETNDVQNDGLKKKNSDRVKKIRDDVVKNEGNQIGIGFWLFIGAMITIMFVNG